MNQPKNPKKWKLGHDQLYRGDIHSGPRPATFGSNPSIVRHILYLEGFGRETPYLSTSELQISAQRFAASGGRIYTADPATWLGQNVGHIPRAMLNQLLTGKGKGNANWNRASDVRRARELVELHFEHLADFGKITSQANIDAVTLAIFK